MSDNATTSRARNRRALRTALGVVNIVAAIVVTLALGYNIGDRVDQNAFIETHYFGFFTVQTTILDIAVLAVGGIYALTRATDTCWYTAVRACTVAYAFIVGGVYNLMLTGFPPVDGYIPTSTIPNDLQHVWIPLFLVAEWIVMPGRAAIRWRVVGLGLLFPVVWAAATFARGTLFDGWFPYFFMNPNRVGLFGVLGYLSVMAAIIAVVTALAIVVTPGRRATLAVASAS